MRKLSKKEITAAEKLFTILCASQNALDRELEAVFKNNSNQVKQSIVDGVDKFYTLYSKDGDEKTIRDMLAQNMKGMSKVKQYSYLSNLLVALTHVCGNIIEGEKWGKLLEEHSVILKAIEMGLMEEDGEEVQTGIDDMLDLVTSNIDACSVLFIGEPPYEKLFSACLTENPETVEALAVNTRSSAVNMAAALYILQERGELTSLGETKIPPQEMGVMAASLMEIDAAHKSGSWDGAKTVIEKAAKTATILIVTSPDILKDTIFFAFVGLLTNFSVLWMLIAGAILAINVRIRHNTVKEHMEPVFKVGAKMMKVGLDMVQKISHKFSEWIETSLLSKALPVWKKCSDFAVNGILIPAAAFLIRAKEEVLRRADIALNKVEAAFSHLKEEVTDVVDNARNHNKDDVVEESEQEEEFDLEPVTFETEESCDEEGVEILID